MPAEPEIAGKAAGKWRGRVARVLFLLALGILWESLSRAGVWNELIFPAPGAVIRSLADGIGDGSLPRAVGASMVRLGIGYSISLLIGIPAGMLLGRLRLLDDTVGSLAVGLQALPSICWLPLAVLWFGLSESAMQFVIIMGSLMAITLTVRDGVKTIPTLYLRAAPILGATGWRFYRYVLFPASFPSVMTGAKLGWTFAWRSLMAAELLYVTTGIGSTLMMGRELHDMPLVIAAMIAIIVIGLITDRLVFRLGEDFVHRRWGVG
ncbi:putative ABC transporter permease protein [Geobacter sp. OR-1]|uniref:ABC transporter permease n=1 Tax=Geobacter sp. OR-1 TaxID=1266765 RepID=UPI000541FEE2|nr:ABC transporter permease [Geobacter sp. OR-1]GAM08910.1 putative ABC transporter permease protein [Geobacter sp. OR-1]